MRTSPGEYFKKPLQQQDYVRRPVYYPQEEIQPTQPRFNYMPLIIAGIVCVSIVAIVAIAYKNKK